MAIGQAACVANPQPAPKPPPQGETLGMLDLANEADAVQRTDDSAWAKHGAGSARDLCGEQGPSHGTD